jgi:hypothetical protein
MPVTTCDDCGLQHDAALPHRCAVDELRDAFAMHALTGLMAGTDAALRQDLVARANGKRTICEIIAGAAYDYADAMIAERRRRRDAAREGA